MRRLSMVWAGFLLASMVAPAQQFGTPPDHPYTLHVYTDLIQIPTLILDSDGKPIPALKKEQIAISLDSGKQFAPTRMHVAGEDPLAISVLLDVSSEGPEMLEAFRQALASVSGLGPQDLVSVYALDCALVRTANELPPADPSLQTAVSRALAAPELHGKKHKTACGNTVMLWDALARINTYFPAGTHRPVMIVVSDGDDGRSALSWQRASLLTGSRGIALFAIRNKSDFTLPRVIPVHAEDPLKSMTSANGGYLFDIDTSAMLPTLQRIITMLRARYVIEFPRPAESEAGLHDLRITVQQMHATVRPTGVTAPLVDPTLAADPTTVSTSSSPATYGKHKPQQQKP